MTPAPRPEAAPARPGGRRAPLRLVLLAPDLFDAVGGIQTFNRTLALALGELAQRHGWEVEALVLNDRGGSPEAAKYLAGGRVRYRAFDRSRARFAAAAVRAALRAGVVLVGHVNFAPLALAMPGRARHLAVYGVEVWRPLPRLVRAGVARMRRFLTISDYTRDRMAGLNGLDAARFVAFPTTLDPLRTNGASPRGRASLGVPEGARVVLTVTRLAAEERYKGVDTLIRALPTVLERVPDTLYVVVGDGTDRPRLEALAREHGVAERVRFAGRVSDAELAEWYHAADVFALPSWGEGFGIVFLEAMEAARPCVAARAGAAPEVVEDGVTGLLAEPDDHAGLAAALVALLEDEGLRERMGRAGRERLERRFSYPLFRERLEGVLRA